MDLKTCCDILVSADTTDDVLCQYLSKVNANISILDQDNENIVQLILKINWTDRDEKVIQCYRELVLNLVTAYNMYLRSVLRMIIRHFLPLSEENSRNINSHVHELLKGISKLIPRTPLELLPLLAENFPYMRRNAFILSYFVKNLLHLTEYLADSRPAVLQLIVTKLLQIDVHCPRIEIAELEDPDEACETEPIFKMETDATNNEMRHPLANTLDILINELYSYVATACSFMSNPENLNWEMTKKIYKDLLLIFEVIILPTHACAHVQFIMFYICSFRNLLCEGFVDYLWKKVQNPNISPIIRQASACYLGSFLARAKYVPINMVQDCLKLLCNWITGYVENLNGTCQVYVDVVRHSTFYAVCQVVFYLVTFRHKEMVHDKKGLRFLQELNLERIVNCRLNPLRICLPGVVKNFASITRNYQIAYCYTILERNARLFLPTCSEQSISNTTSFTTLETFFPFDPYLLKRSGKVIQPLYRVYDDQQEEEIDNEEPELENMSFGSPPLLPDLLCRDVSPGYRRVRQVSH